MEIRLERKDIIKIYQSNEKFLAELEMSLSKDREWFPKHVAILDLKTSKLSIEKGDNPRLSHQIKVFTFPLYLDVITSPPISIFEYLDQSLVNLRLLEGLSHQHLIYHFPTYFAP